jgi:hypothetical protein
VAAPDAGAVGLFVAAVSRSVATIR